MFFLYVCCLIILVPLAWDLVDKPPGLSQYSAFILCMTAIQMSWTRYNNWIVAMGSYAQPSNNAEFSHGHILNSVFH